MGRTRTGNVEVRADDIRLRFTLNGVRHYEALPLTPSASNIKAAQRLLAKIMAEIDAGVFDYGRHFPDRALPNLNEPDAILFETYANAWLNTYVGAASTLRVYKLHTAIWIGAFKGRTIASIKHSEVKKAVADRAKGVSAKTVNNAMHPLRGIFNAAVEDEIIEKSPADKVKTLKHQAPKPDPFTIDEMNAVLAYMRTRYPEQVYNYFDFAFATGMRTSELIAVKWADVNWEAKYVTISTARVEGEEKGTKTEQVRDVDLTEAALAALLRQKAHTFLKNEHDEIFYNPNTGSPWHDDGQQRESYWNPCLTALSLRKRVAYQTRHTFATIRLMHGVNPAYIARQLGHSNTMMLFKHYAKWIDGADKGREQAKVAAIPFHESAQPKAANE